MALRFLMGLALGGLLPSVTALIRHSVPDRVCGAVLGYAQSAQYLGQIAGPLVGGFVGAHLGMPAVFLATGALMLAGAGLNLWVFRLGWPRAPQAAGVKAGQVAEAGR